MHEPGRLATQCDAQAGLRGAWRAEEDDVAGVVRVGPFRPGNAITVRSMECWKATSKTSRVLSSGNRVAVTRATRRGLAFAGLLGEHGYRIQLTDATTPRADHTLDEATQKRQHDAVSPLRALRDERGWAAAGGAVRRV